MIDIGTVVAIFFWAIVVGCIFGLMVWLTYYIAGQWPTCEPYMRFFRIGLVILAVFVAISALLGFLGHPIVRF